MSHFTHLVEGVVGRVKSSRQNRREKEAPGYESPVASSWCAS